MEVLVIAFTVTLLASIVSLIDKWKSTGNRKKNNTIAVLLFTTAILGSLLALWSGFDSLRSKEIADKTANVKQEQFNKQQGDLLELQKVNMNLSRQNLTYSKQLQNSTYQNTALSKRLLKRAEQIDDFNKGIGSFCYIVLDQVGSNKGVLWLLAQGINPIHDVQMRIVDLDLPNYKTYQDVLDRDIARQIPVIYPGFAEDLGIDVKLTKGKNVNLNIFYSANGVSYIQSLRLRFYKDKWLTATIVYSYKNKNPLLKQIDKDFPNGANIFK